MWALLLASSLCVSPATPFEQRRERAAPASRTVSPPSGGPLLGFGLGPAFFLGNGPATFKFGPRLGYELAPLMEGLSVAITLPITLSYSRSQDSLSTIERFGVELLPGARASYTLLPKLRLYLDLGLGAVLYQFNVQLLGNREGSAAGFAVRVGVGAEYELIDRLSVFLEPMQLLLQAVPSVVYRFGNDVVMASNMPPHYGVVLGVHYRL